tara:strand:- start:240 stop:458 length:219 start_codon:yes stop_codon:yes gene_type:complete
MMLTTIIASALVLGTVKEVSSLYSKTQQIETLKKQIKFKEGQIDLLLTAKSIAQQKQTINKCECKALQTSKK